MTKLERYNPEFDELVKSIGRVAAQYSDVEFHISETLWLLMNVEREIGACLTAQMIGAGPRMRALMSILALRGAPPTVIEKVKALVKRITRASSKRNRVVHDPWLRDFDGSYKRVHLTADNKLDFAIKAENLDDIDEIYNELVRIRSELDDLRNTIKREVPSWLRSQFEQSEGIKTYSSEPHHWPGDDPSED